MFSDVASAQTTPIKLFTAKNTNIAHSYFASMFRPTHHIILRNKTVLPEKNGLPITETRIKIEYVSSAAAD